MEEDQQIIDDIDTKKGRHRKKQLYNSIREQMEFYFGDSNLSKDRFLSQLISVDPYIDLLVFLKFNKIRNLTTKIEDICKALRKSEILELSEDNLKVCRKTPIQLKENQDECTVYVERLPVDTEHDWLKTIFSKFGTVDYVSIPKYKHNKMIKGFAFVEFSAPDAVQKVLEYFESIDCKLPTTMLPEQLASISTFEKELTQENIPTGDSSKSGSKNSDAEMKSAKVEVPDEKIKPNDEKVSRKRSATSHESEDCKKKKKKSKEDATEDATAVEPKDQEGENEDVKKKRRKGKKSRKNVLDLQQIGLQVLSKKDWKQLRNKYLNLQKQKMKNLKEQFNKNRFSHNVNTAENNSGKTSSKSQSNEKDSGPRFKLTPGTIVSVQLKDTCVDIKKFKSEVRNYSGIEYIDIAPGNDTGFLRFKDNSSAEKFCASSFNADMKLLEGNVEKEYWDKIVENRENKFKKEAGKKQRGRDKLLRKAEKELGKHIKFDD